MTRMIAAAAIIATGLCCNPALACKGTEVLLQDDFKTVDLGWDTADGFTIGSGQAKWTNKDDAGMAIYYNGSLFTDFDYCIDLTTLEKTTPEQAAGLVFWATDYNNRYIFQLLSRDGQAEIVRRQNGKSLFPVANRKFDAIKTDAGAINSLRVVVKGNTFTAYVNDKMFVTAKGQPPKDGSQIGIYLGSPDAFAFSNVKITNVP
jgi:hypothetical protein